MARLREALILDEISFLDERLGSNPLLTIRNIFYFLGGGLIAYKLFESGRAGLQLIGILIFAFTVALILYPRKSTTLESVIIGMLSYFLGFDVTTEKKGPAKKEKAKKAEKVKGETKTKTARRPAVPVIPNIMNILALGRKTKASKPMLTGELTRQKTRKLPLQFTWLDYAIIAIGLASGVLGIVMFNKAFWSLEVREVYVSAVMIVAGFSASIERVLELLRR